MIIPKRKSMVEGLENVIVSLYAKGMSVSDIEEKSMILMSPQPRSLV